LNDGDQWRRISGLPRPSASSQTGGAARLGLRRAANCARRNVSRIPFPADYGPLPPFAALSTLLYGWEASNEPRSVCSPSRGGLRIGRSPPRLMSWAPRFDTSQTLWHCNQGCNERKTSLRCSSEPAVQHRAAGRTLRAVRVRGWVECEGCTRSNASFKL
jgi:hypothetical protein